VYKDEFLRIFPLLKNLLSVKSDNELSSSDLKPYRHIYIGDFNEVLRFDVSRTKWHSAQVLRWSVDQCSPHFTCGTPSTHQLRPSGHVAHTPTSNVRWSWCAGVTNARPTQNAIFASALVLHWCAKGRTTNALGTSSCSHAKVQGQKGKL